MERRRKIRRTWILTIVTVVIVYILGDLLFGGFFSKKYANYLEHKVQHKIVDNYYQHESTFEELIMFANNLPELSELEFYDNKIRIHIIGSNYLNLGIAEYNRSKKDSLHFDLSHKFQHNHYIKSIDFSSNGMARIECSDTTIYTHFWDWNFYESITHEDCSKLSALTNLTKQQLSKLQIFMNKINCEAIEIKYDKRIQLRFSGHSYHNYSYFINFSNADFLGHDITYFDVHGNVLDKTDTYYNLQQIRPNINIGAYQSPTHDKDYTTYFY